VERLKTQLANVNAPIVGVVLNGSSERRSTYHYAHRPLAETHGEAAAGPLDDDELHVLRRRAVERDRAHSSG
jgi:Mrp family chromosome partitioning ATPase